MKTVRDSIASQHDGSSQARWALVELDGRWALVDLTGSPQSETAFLDGPFDLTPGELQENVSALLGCPVRLSRVEADGDVGYYVTPAEGG